MKVLVLGGEGFFGARVRAAIAALPGVEAAAGGRRAAVRVDLADAATFATLDGYDVVVNCTDALAAPPDRAVAHVIAAGKIWVETSNDAPLYDRLAASGGDGPGAVVLGAGLFPGMSNAVGVAAARAVEGCTRVDVGITIEPFSGAGGAMCAVMADLMAAPARWIEDGKPATGRALSGGARVPFEKGERRVWRAAFPEPALIARATGVPHVTIGLTTRRRWLAPLFVLGALFMPRWRPLQRIMQAITRGSLRLMRAVLLRRVAAPIEIVAVATGAGGATARRRFYAEDGIAAGGELVAQAVARLAERPGAFRGAVLPDALLSVPSSSGAGSSAADAPVAAG